jgi:tRNA(Ile)-lysidine synthase
MPARAGAVLRPLLDVTREQLQAYAQSRSLDWTEDPSNADERFGRNFLRRRVIPLLRERWPGLGAAISRSAALAGEARELLALRAAEQLGPARQGAALNVPRMRQLSEADRRNVLRYWLEQRGLPLPDARRLREIAGPMLKARHDAQPLVQWNGAQVRRHGDLLHALVPQPAAHAQRGRGALRWHWRRNPRLQLPDGGSLELRTDPRGELVRSPLPATLTVAFRDTGGAPARNDRRVKRALQAASLAPWERSGVPLLWAGSRLVAVGDLWRAPEWRAGPSARASGRCRLRWRRAGTPGN